MHSPEVQQLTAKNRVKRQKTIQVQRVEQPVQRSPRETANREQPLSLSKTLPNDLDALIALAIQHPIKLK